MSHPANPHQALRALLAHDSRYHPNAYALVLGVVQQAVRRLPKPRHISGRELLDALRQEALEAYGPMTRIVLNTWGLRTTDDVGEVVFRLIAAGFLSKSPEDHPEDFRDVYRFEEVFDRASHYRWPVSIEPAPPPGHG